MELWPLAISKRRMKVIIYVKLWMELDQDCLPSFSSAFRVCNRTLCSLESSIICVTELSKALHLFTNIIKVTCIFVFHFQPHLNSKLKWGTKPPGAANLPFYNAKLKERRSDIYLDPFYRVRWHWKSLSPTRSRYCLRHNFPMSWLTLLDSELN